MKGVGTWQKVQWLSLRTNVLRAAVTKSHQLEGLNNRILFSCSSGGEKSIIKLPAGLGSPEGFLLSWQTASFLSTVLFSMRTHPWCLFLFIDWHQLCWIRAPPNGLILPELPLYRPYLQYSNILRCRVALKHKNSGGTQFSL